jgi:hypothetical protein
MLSTRIAPLGKNFLDVSLQPRAGAGSPAKGDSQVAFDLLKIAVVKTLKNPEEAHSGK